MCHMFKRVVIDIPNIKLILYGLSTQSLCNYNQILSIQYLVAIFIAYVTGS